jgi:hypothetical protein
MKKNFTMLLSLAAVATFASPVVARAQVSNPLKFTVFGGAALPSGDTGNELKTGYTVGGAVDFRAPLMPLGLRGELIYSRLDEKDNGGFQGLNRSELGGDANAVFWLPSAATPLKAYLTAGPSYSRIAENGDDAFGGSISVNKWGFNAGGGIDFGLGGLSTRLDLRYRQISMGNGVKFQTVPITFGLTF